MLKLALILGAPIAMLATVAQPRCRGRGRARGRTRRTPDRGAGPAGVRPGRGGARADGRPGQGDAHARARTRPPSTWGSRDEVVEALAAAPTASTCGSRGATAGGGGQGRPHAQGHVKTARARASRERADHLALAGAARPDGRIRTTALAGRLERRALHRPRRRPRRQRPRPRLGLVAVDAAQ